MRVVAAAAALCLGVGSASAQIVLSPDALPPADPPALQTSPPPEPVAPAADTLPAPRPRPEAPALLAAGEKTATSFDADFEARPSDDVPALPIETGAGR